MLMRLISILLAGALAACSGGGSAATGNSTSVTVTYGSAVAVGAVTGIVPANVQSISVEALAGGVRIAGPVMANRPNFSPTFEVPNGTGIVIRASAFDAANGGGAKVYEGSSAPVTLIGLPATVPVTLSMWISITPVNSQVLAWGVVNLTATVAGVAPTSASRLLWSGSLGTVLPIDPYGGLVDWTAPAGAGTYTISARVDPYANPDQSPNIVGQATITVLPEADTDGDGLNDRIEGLLQQPTNPNNPDTDGDGFADGLEYFNSTAGGGIGGADPYSALATPYRGASLITGFTPSAGDRFGTSFAAYSSGLDLYTAVGIPGFDGQAGNEGAFQEFLFPAVGAPVLPGRFVVGQAAGGLLGSNLASNGSSIILVQEPGSSRVLNYDPYALTLISPYTGQSAQFGNAFLFLRPPFDALPIPLIADPLSRTIDYIDPYGQLNSLMTGATAGFASAMTGATFGQGFGDNFVVGSPDASSAAGIVEIYNNSAFPPLQPPQVTLSGTNAGDRFGAALATGYLNGDFFADLIIGAPGEDKVYIYYGPLPFTTPSAVITGQAGSQFGAEIAVGDINGDTYADIVIGAPLADVTGGHVDAGIIYAYSGNTFKLLKQINGYLPGQDFAKVIYVSDVNGDAYADILVGEPLNDIYGYPLVVNSNAGAAYLIPGP